MLPPGAIFKLKIHQNAYAAGASPHWEAYRAPRPTAIVFRQTLRGRGGEEGKEENGRGSACPLLFTCAYFISAVIATATWLGGWLGGWLSVTAGIVSKRLNLS